jgi:hypothetical protein
VTDPFGTAALRASVLDSWRSSPTRFREDANAEEDLYLGGYRDRLLVELAQNAADAAGQNGVLRVHVENGELRVANTGAPLTADGVTALASLRASAKSDGVGRFGVGFAAVLTVSDAPRIVSTTGGVAFSADRTRAEFGATGRVPVLRLPWPTDETPPDGFDTEVRLPLRDDVDTKALLDVFADQATDLLLSLDGLTRLEIGDRVWHRESGNGWTDTWQNIHGPDGMTRWVIVRDTGELPAELTAALGAEARSQWTVCWALRLDEHRHPDPPAEDVLHAPTRTDERLSLPARLIATLPIEPSRRRVLPGLATDVVLKAAAALYPKLLRNIDAGTKLVPLPGFPLSEVDERLRQGILAELRVTPWLPAAGKGSVAPAKACLLPAPEAPLAEVLAETIPGLVDAELAAPEHSAALAALDVPRLGLAELTAALTGIDRPPSWWRFLYAALEPILDVDPKAREELGGLPVPLVDGRTIPGPRSALLLDAELTAELTDVDTPVNVVHPAAVHPVLERLGARRGDAGDVLDTLVDAVERSVDDAESGLDTTPLVDLVLRLVRSAGARPWLGALALPDSAGDFRRADELALPGATFVDLLDEDAPIGVLAEHVAQEWPAETLTAVGVLDSFALVVDEDPTGPDHDLDDETTWWETRDEPPSRLVAVRDLDLVADHAWPAALLLLAAEPDTWRALHEPGGYTGWWIGHHARLDGLPPIQWRLPDATALAGLYDPVPDLDLDPAVLSAVGVRTTLAVTSADDADDLLARLGDEDRVIPAGAALRAHAALAAAGLDPAELDPPTHVRAISGAVAPAADCLVLDGPWLLGVTEPDRVVGAGPDFTLAEPLAELLDLPLASDAVAAEVTSEGELVRWADLGAVVDACDLAGLPVPSGGPLVHQQLTVTVGTIDYDLAWWIDDGIVHCADSAEGLARALAWTTDHWADRHALAALLTDPDSYLA